MVRPRKPRFVKFNPKASYFKPRGIPLVDLEEVRLAVEELEALRLADLLCLSHEQAGQRMGVSRATFGRIIARARKTLAEALVHGKAILVEGGDYKMVALDGKRCFACEACGHRWEENRGAGRPETCPSCGGKNVHRDHHSQDTGPGLTKAGKRFRHRKG